MSHSGGRHVLAVAAAVSLLAVSVGSAQAREGRNRAFAWGAAAGAVGVLAGAAVANAGSGYAYPYGGYSYDTDGSYAVQASGYAYPAYGYAYAAPQSAYGYYHHHKPAHRHVYRQTYQPAYVYPSYQVAAPCACANGYAYSYETGKVYAAAPPQYQYVNPGRPWAYKVASREYSGVPVVAYAQPTPRYASSYGYGYQGQSSGRASYAVQGYSYGTQDYYEDQGAYAPRRPAYRQPRYAEPEPQVRSRAVYRSEPEPRVMRERRVERSRAVEERQARPRVYSAASSPVPADERRERPRTIVQPQVEATPLARNEQPQAAERPARRPTPGYGTNRSENPGPRKIYVDGYQPK